MTSSSSSPLPLSLPTTMLTSVAAATAANVNEDDADNNSHSHQCKRGWCLQLQLPTQTTLTAAAAAANANACHNKGRVWAVVPILNNWWVSSKYILLIVVLTNYTIPLQIQWQGGFPSLLITLNNHFWCGKGGIYPPCHVIHSFLMQQGGYLPFSSHCWPIFNVARRGKPSLSCWNQTCQTWGMDIGFWWVTFTQPVPVPVLPIFTYLHRFANSWQALPPPLPFRYCSIVKALTFRL